jgi:two-component system OmpR family sensor kinase
VKLSMRVLQTALFVLVVSVALLVLSSWIVGELDRSIHEVVRAEQLKDAASIAGTLRPSFPANAENVGEIHDRVAQAADIFEDDVRVYDESGKLIDAKETVRIPPAVLAEARTRGFADETPYAVVDLRAGGIAVASKAIYDNLGRKVGVVVVANPATVARQLLATARSQLAIAFWVALVLSGAVGFVLAEFIAKQTRRLNDAADTIAAGDFSRRLPTRLMPAEISDLANAFNNMAEQLGHAFETLSGQERAQREFVANASHELRTPIAALKGAIELLEDGAKEKPEVRDEFLHTMRVEVNRLQRLVDDLFTLAQLDSGRLELRMLPQPLDEVVSVVVAIVRPLANDAGVAVAADLGDGDLTAVCDRDRITQVLIGFVDNAIKHSENGGVVTVSANGVNGSVRLCVHDTGKGIPPEEQQRIFDRFYRADDAPKRDERGSGLGLSIAREIVEAHGSRILVTSAVGEGTTFCFLLRRTFSLTEP